MTKNTIIFVLMLVLFGIGVLPAAAHVVVKPNTAGVGAYTTFTVAVPVEKETPTIGVRLVIPEGVESVMPNVKPGWKIDIKKTGEGEDAKVTEIVWTGGSIPTGQRDEFMFSAKTPAKPTQVAWKAYQTYTNNVVVAWDADPKAEKSHDAATAEQSGPYSVTKVVDDLSSTPAPSTSEKSSGLMNQAIPFAALGLASVALTVALGNKSSS